MVSSERWLKSSDVPNVDEMHSEFANIRVSGFPLSLGKSKVGRPPALQGLYTFECFNASGGRQTLKDKITRSKAHVMLLQEIGYHSDSIEALYSWTSAR
eukprot:8138166-Pyramimonas_sp.AAC.1